jgi:menaquinone-specific isochorismate synthase
VSAASQIAREVSARIVSTLAREPAARFVAAQIDIDREPRELLQSSRSEPSLVWSTGTKPIVGFGCTAIVGGPTTDSASSSIRDSAAALYRSMSSAEAKPPLYGGFTFERDVADDRWPELGRGAFFVPRFRVIPREGAGATLEVVVDAAKLPTERELAQELDLLFGRRERPLLSRAEMDRSNAADFMRAVETALGRMTKGGLEKVVLGQHRRARGSPSPRETAIAALGRRGHARFLFRIGDSALVGATPELLVRSAYGVMRTEAVAGSRAPADTTAPLNDKERREHGAVSSFVTERLDAIACPLAMRPTALVSFGSIAHFVTAFEGPANKHILDVVDALHPTPALAGTPTQTALDLIRSLEPRTRGPFGAPFGYFDEAGEGHFVVAIRSVLSRGSDAHFFAGAGIVAGSDPRREWEETELKLAIACGLLESDEHPESAEAAVGS